VLSNVTFVAGFYTCDEFQIMPRSTPLEIAGTVITKKFTVDPTVITAGVTWSSINHPRALKSLRKHNVLRSADCLASSALSNPAFVPIWHPEPAVSVLANQRRCFSNSLRAKAQPFMWTRIDPDCVLASTTHTMMTCKNDARNYVFSEVGREDNI